MQENQVSKPKIQPPKQARTILECRYLGYTIPNTKVIFENVNIKTYKDELVAVVGPTGTGKSTLLRCLAQLIPPTEGHVYLEGAEVKAPTPNISLIHQSIATFPWMTALDNVKLSLLNSVLTEEEKTKRAEKMLDLVGLRASEYDYPKEMSGGMRQKIAIARSLAASPSVLLLDEPFVHLDEITAFSLRKQIYQLVFNPRSTLKSALLISHNLQEVVQLADRVYIMNGNPATIVNEIKIDLPRPRHVRDPKLFEYIDRIVDDMGLRNKKA